jgi:hypothetical protein
MFHVVERPCDLIFCNVGIKNRLRWNRLSNVLSRRMILRTHNLPSQRLKMRLWWCQWSDVSWCRKAIRTHFLITWHSKMRFGRIRGSDVLCRRVALRTHNVPSGHLKNDLENSMKRCFKVSKGSFSASWSSKKATWTKSLKWCFTQMNGS